MGEGAAKVLGLVVAIMGAEVTGDEMDGDGDWATGNGVLTGEGLGAPVAVEA